MWGENWPRALGQVVWNFGSILLGVGVVKRVDNILAAGRQGRDGDGGPDGDRTPDQTPGSRYESGDPLRPGNHPPGRPTLGSTDGGPGEWTQVNRREGPWRDYQEQITGAQGDPGKPIEYRVTDANGNRVDYDGRVVRDGQPPQEVYLEAKGESWFFNEKNASKPSLDSMRQRELDRNVDQIDRQLDMMPDGAKLEWHVESPDHARALEERLRGTDYADDVTIVHTPRASGPAVGGGP